MKKLSTPHGTLGTCYLGIVFVDGKVLSTPHGTLGTPNDYINQNKTYQSLCQKGTLFE